MAFASWTQHAAFSPAADSFASGRPPDPDREPFQTLQYDPGAARIWQDNHTSSPPGR